MAGNVTKFQRTYTFKPNATYKTVGLDQAVVYSVNMRDVEVPEQDNLKPVGVVTYQFADRDMEHVAVQLDGIVMVTAAEDIKFGDDVIVGAGGTVKKAESLPTGTVANVLGEAQNTVKAGEKAQILIRPKTRIIQ